MQNLCKQSSYLRIFFRPHCRTVSSHTMIKKTTNLLSCYMKKVSHLILLVIVYIEVKLNIRENKYAVWKRRKLCNGQFSAYFSSFLNNRFLRERGMASNPKMQYQVFLCIFQMIFAMATLGLKEMGKFLWEGREKGLTCWLSQFST